MSVSLAVLALAGCAGPRSAAVTHLPSLGKLTPVESYILAIPGQTLVIPVAPTGEVDPAGRAAPVVLDDGRRLTARVHRLYASSSGQAPRWMSSARAWSSSGSAPTPRVGSIWLDVVVVKMPDDAFGKAAQLEGRELALDWRRSPTNAHDVFARTLTPQTLDSAKAKMNLLATLRPALGDPFFRWRARLLADRLREAGFASLPDRIDASTFESPPIEALANQVELRARLGLERLASADALIARDFAQALTRIATLGPDRVAPVWTPIGQGADDSGLTALLESSLDDSVADVDLLARVEAWLATQPRAVGWVVDDAGLASPEEKIALCKMRIADLAGVGGVGSAALGGGPPGPRVTIGPMGSRAVVASSPLASAPRTATMRLGRSWSRQAPIVAGAIEAAPPGVLVKGMYQPWSLEGWLVGGATPAPIDSQTAALLRRTVDGKWELYVECRTPTDGAMEGDVMRVWFGPAKQPRAVVRIDPAGFVVNELEQVKEGEEPTRQPIVVRQLSDRWVCVLPIPNEAIEVAGYLRLGMERRNDAGARSTWPRPILPWQETPGRALIDLNNWMSLAPGK